MKELNRFSEYAYTIPSFRHFFSATWFTSYTLTFILNLEL